jgi:glyoxylase-like metal-dependent hydrolase (beta-lactamase superfamily II)
MTAHYTQIADDLILITLKPPIDGFDNFISAWLYRGDVTFLVDVGPASTAPGLLQVLADVGVEHLDYILLTHIHLDHAGAIGEVSAKFSRTPIICHPAGIPHLIEPARLWEGTRKVLGATAEAYGPITAVAAERLLDATQFESGTILPLVTPGHASHHLSFKTGDYLFAGEAAGVYCVTHPDSFYLRPATPPRFYFDTAVESIDILLHAQPHQICYAHYGMANDGIIKLETARQQLFSWKAIVRNEVNKPESNDLTERCKTRLLQEDPLLADFHHLNESVQSREEYFLGNSINGFIGYLTAGLKGWRSS